MNLRQMLDKIGESPLGVLIGFEAKAKAHLRECRGGPGCPHAVLNKAKKLSVARGKAHGDTTRSET
jgi:hypothetical protein